MAATVEIAEYLNEAPISLVAPIIPKQREANRLLASPARNIMLRGGSRSGKTFGYIAGLSRGCVAEEKQTAFEKDVLDIYAGVSRLLGIDRAFLFSTAFGYGTSVEIERENCGEILEQYEGRATKFRSAAQGE